MSVTWEHVWQHSGRSFKLVKCLSSGFSLVHDKARRAVSHLQTFIRLSLARLHFLHKYLTCVKFMILFADANEIEDVWRVRSMFNLYWSYAGWCN